MAKNWGESFADAFTSSFESSQERAFKAWQEKQQAPLKLEQQKGQLATSLKNQVDIGAITPEQAMEQWNMSYGQATTPVMGMSAGDVVVPPTKSGVVAPTVMPTGTEWQASKLNAMGVPTGYERKPDGNADLAKASAEAVSGVSKMSSGMENYLDQYARSTKELTKYFPDEDVGAKGIGGKITRAKGKLANWKEDLPETAVLEDTAKIFAQETATALEGRATDEDRKIWIDVFPNALTASSAKNIRQASNQLISMQLKLKGTGKDINDMVSNFYTSDSPELKKIAEQFYEKFPEYKAKALGIPEGWEIVNE